MSNEKQVNKCHYDFVSYMDLNRWVSVWHQINEVIKRNPKNVLEVGPGPGIFKNIAKTIGLNLETIDLDPDLNPDHVGSATSLPFADASFDITCAFQMLEHLPYAESLAAFKEMVRVSKKFIIISLPDAQPVFRWRIYIPKLAAFDRLLPRLNWKPKDHIFDGEHYWEINKKNHLLKNIIVDLSNICTLEKTYRVLDNPYHRFFIFSK